MTMRRNWLRITVFALLSLLILSACGGGSSTADNSAGDTPGVLDKDKKYTVEFWEAFATSTNKTALETLTKQYMEKNPNVTIKLQAFDSYDTLRTKLNGAISDGKPPAMAQVYESWAMKYKQSDALASLKPYIEGKNGFSKDELNDFYPVLLKDGELEGEQYMLPFNKSVIVLYYNEDMLKKEGIAVPQTFDELNAAIQKLTKSDGSRWGLSLTPSVDDWSILYKAFGGGDFTSSDGTKAVFGDEPNAKASLQALKNFAPLVKSGAVHVTKQYNWQNDFASGKAAFAISTVASYPFVKKAVDGKFKVNQAVMPSGPSGHFTSLFGTNLAMFSGVDNDTRNAAWDYMKFLVSSASNSYFVQQTGYMPVRKSAAESPELKKYFEQNPDRKAGPDSMAYGFVPSVMPAWDDCRTEITTNYTSALTGQASPEDALKKMSQACSSALSQG